MARFSRKDNGSNKPGGKVVVTGKRINGTWVMESSLPPNRKRVKNGDAILQSENNPIRTIH